MRRRAVFPFVSLALVVLFPLASRGQSTPDGSVTGTGVVEIRRAPEVMRMEITLTADGADAKEAASRLKELQTSAKSKLAALGAVDATIDLGVIKVQQANERQQQVQRMMRMQRGNRKPTTGPAVPPTSVMAAVKAEWPLPKGSPEDLFVAAMDLQKKIGAAGLAASKKPLTPEEQEQLEESGGMNSDEPPPGTPSFLFVSKVSDADKAKAMGEAFAKAKAEAGRLATAAGGALGAVRHLSSVASPEFDESAQYNTGYRRYMYAMMQQQQTGRAVGAEMSEAIGTQPTDVSLQLTLTAAFALK